MERVFDDHANRILKRAWRSAIITGLIFLVLIIWHLATSNLHRLPHGEEWALLLLLVTGFMYPLLAGELRAAAKSAAIATMVGSVFHFILFVFYEAVIVYGLVMDTGRIHRIIIRRYSAFVVLAIVCLTVAVWLAKLFLDVWASAKIGRQRAE